MARIHALRRALRATALHALIAAALAVVGPALVAGASPHAAPPSGLDAWEIDVDAAGFEAIRVGGFDVLTVDPVDTDRWRVGLALTGEDVDRMNALGLVPALWRDPVGRTYARTWDAVQQEGGFTVYRSWDEEGGIRDELHQLAADHPDLVKLVVYGQSVQGRDLLALKVTKDAATTEDGAKPATMYSALQHAREWIAIETNRRLLHHFVEGYGTDPEITQLLTDNELWFIVACNPDGYQHTFTQGNRLWRKNLRDNDGDGQITAQNDGVDPNRNFAANWNYDAEGSSGSPGSGTYRGDGPASEPETAAYQDLMQRIGFRFVVNYHSAAELILWPEGWQDQTHTADDPIYRTLAGTIPTPAIEGFAPILSAGLYITNGETCDYAHSMADALCYTPELSTPPQGSGGSGFEFPDDEALIQAEFEKNLPFAMDIARSTADPANPVSHLGNTAAPMIAEPFAVSHGAAQPVEANVRRDLGDVEMVFSVDGGAEQRVPTVEWEGGERFGASGDVHYRRVRGTVTGASTGDRVAVRFEAGGEATAPFEYVVAADTGNPVLLVVDEDYTGVDPVYDDPSGPRWADAVAETLVDLDIAFDVYDVDAHGRVAPSALGVLSHYDAVVWHTGDDVAPRLEGMTGGAVSRRALHTMLAMRAYLNEGGKVVYAGKHAGGMFFRGMSYDPVADLSCNLDADEGGPAYCESLSNDFPQYYLGAWGYDDVADASGARLVGGPGPLEGLEIPLQPAGSPHMGLFSLTAEAMPGEAYQRFAGAGLATVAGTGVRPRTGEHYLYSGEVPYAWQRVTRTVALTDATTASLSFWTHRETRQPFDALIVEARATSGDAWTTLPDANGHTSQTAALSCQSAQWFGLFPHIAHYMTPDENAEGGCAPVGTTGAWHAATGASEGWEEWTVDLSAYAGGEAEVSITYVRSRIAFFGVLLDDVALTVDGAVVAETSFEGDLGGWTLAGLETNGQPHTPEKDFRLATHADMPQPEGSAIVVTADSALLGFGLESLPRADRAEVLRRLLGHIAPDLDGTPRPTPTPPPTTREGAIYLPVAGKEWRQ